jgi:hypothetical protein
LDLHPGLLQGWGFFWLNVFVRRKFWNSFCGFVQLIVLVIEKVFAAMLANLSFPEDWT